MSSGSSRGEGKMGRLSAHRRSPKQAKAKEKNQQIKVVYISNPMRFKASAAEFKGLVQQFTGQDSDVANLQSRFTDAAALDEPCASSTADRGSGSTDDDDSAAAGLSRADQPVAAPHDHQQQHDHRQHDEPNKFAGAAAFDLFDEVFTPQVLENLAAFMPSSSLYYEAPPPDVGALRRLDAA